MMDARSLAEAWIRLHHLPKDSKERETLDWSWKNLTSVVSADAGRCLEELDSGCSMDSNSSYRRSILVARKQTLATDYGGRGRPMPRERFSPLPAIGA
jgi:hypothetical protein